MPTKFAAKLFAATEVGTPVYVGGYPPYFNPELATND
jgi:hypothetical protein